MPREKMGMLPSRRQALGAIAGATSLLAAPAIVQGAKPAHGEVRAAARTALHPRRHHGQRRHPAAGGDQARPRQDRSDRHRAERSRPHPRRPAVGRCRLRHRGAAVSADAVGEDTRHGQRGEGGRHRQQRRHDALHHQPQRQDACRFHRQGPHRRADREAVVQRHDAADGGRATVERSASSRPSDRRARPSRRGHGAVGRLRQGDHHRPHRACSPSPTAA